jgi:hypothetical protein
MFFLFHSFRLLKIMFYYCLNNSLYYIVTRICLNYVCVYGRPLAVCILKCDDRNHGSADTRNFCRLVRTTLLRTIITITHQNNIIFRITLINVTTVLLLPLVRMQHTHKARPTLYILPYNNTSNHLSVDRVLIRRGFTAGYKAYYASAHDRVRFPYRHS